MCRLRFDQCRETRQGRIGRIEHVEKSCWNSTVETWIISTHLRVKAIRSGFPRRRPPLFRTRARSLARSSANRTLLPITDLRFASGELRPLGGLPAQADVTRRVSNRRRWIAVHASTRGGTRSRNGYYRVRARARARAIVRVCEKRRKWRRKRRGRINLQARESMRAAFLPL